MGTTTLRVVLDGVAESRRTARGTYSLELARSLVASAPRGCDVQGIIPSLPQIGSEHITELIPGLGGLFTSALDRRQLAAAWQHGFTRLPGTGMVHAPTLLAPLYRHDRVDQPGEQVVATIHDAIAWTHPELLPPRQAAWQRSMGRRAQRYADAIVVPTHTVAQQIADVLDLGERLRVIAGAVSSSLVVGDDADARAEALRLPERYVLAVGPFGGQSGMRELMWSLVDLHAPDIALVIVGADDTTELDRIQLDTRLPSHRLLRMGRLDDADLAVVYGRASALVVPSLAEGLALPVLEAMSLGTPVIHSDASTLLEVAADAGHIVPRGDEVSFPRRLAEAMRDLLNDRALADELTVRGRDRARAFSWRDSAEKTWQLHADL